MSLLITTEVSTDKYITYPFSSLVVTKKSKKCSRIKDYFTLGANVLVASVDKSVLQDLI